MKKIFYIFIGLIILTTVSCSDYLDINQDPNNPQGNQLKPQNLLAAALVNPFRTQAITLNDYGNVMSNSWAGNVNAFTGGYRNEFTMDFTTSTRSAIWDNLYIGMGNLNNVAIYPNPSGEYDNFVGVAKIMRSYYMQFIVDLYGDAPYSEAWKRNENLTPKYDDDKSIYLDLFKQLEDGRTLLSSASSVAIDEQDVVFHGDLNKWIDFANTVELKMWLRLSNLSSAQLGTELAALKSIRLAALSSSTFVSADVTINPGYTNATLAQNNPFYSVWGPAANGSTAGTNRNFSVASEYMAKVLMGTQNNTHVNSTGVLDPRRARIFRTATGQPANTIRGVVQGDVAANAGGGAPATLSLIGVGVTGYTGSGAADAHLNGSSKDGYIMLLSESLFLQSEASQVFTQFSGFDGKTLFEDGIRASFAYHSKDLTTIALTDIVATTYLTQINTKLGLGWNATPNKIEAIMTQKWIALCGIHGIEPFLDLVRTGYPNVPLAIIANHTSKPRRLLYPTSEYTANSANVPNVALDQLFSVNSSSPFWVTQ